MQNKRDVTAAILLIIDRNRGDLLGVPAAGGNASETAGGLLSTPGRCRGHRPIAHPSCPGVARTRRSAQGLRPMAETGRHARSAGRLCLSSGTIGIHPVDDLHCGGHVADPGGCVLEADLPSAAWFCRYRSISCLPSCSASNCRQGFYRFSVRSTKGVLWTFLRTNSMVFPLP